ncbi:MAG: hypothetical protein AAGI07_08110 [Bacteroidota bacterium]
MRNISIAILILFFCTACPYESPVPISKKGNKMIKSLVGKWYRAEDKQLFYLIEKADKHNYRIIEHAYNEKTESYDLSIYKGFITELKGVYFLNISQYKANTNEILVQERPTYYLYKLKVTDEKIIQLFPLSNYIREVFSKSEELKKFISQNMHLSFFYGEEETLLRSE